jgi:uncharacterized Tic20 family protein|tara:strand:+ start:1358 stop:1591 length:234 start_codon:yes stop_codon:yes gene_type:complete
MKEFLNYQYMITPGILKILSYVGMVVAVVVGLFTLTQDVVAGISLTVLGPIAVRLYTELMLVIFEIHKELKEMNGKR